MTQFSLNVLTGLLLRVSLNERGPNLLKTVSSVFLTQKTQKMWKDLSEISCLFLIQNNHSGFGGTVAIN